jgi:hypothetical protein
MCKVGQEGGYSDCVDFNEGGISCEKWRVAYIIWW